MTTKITNNAHSDMQRRDWICLGIILIGAILFRLIFMANFGAVGFDEVNYLKLAAAAKMNGLNHVLHTYWPPICPLAVALFSYLIPNFELAGRLFSILCASMVIVPIFFFVKSHFDKNIAFISALFIAFFSFSAYFSARAETEFIYSIVAIGGILIGWNVLKNKKLTKAFVVGVLFGLAYLTRPEGIGFLITFWVISLVVIISQIINKKKVLPYIMIILLSGTGIAIVSFPYLLFLRQATGTWTISTKGTSNQQGEMYVRNKSQFREHPFHTLSEDNKRLLQDEIYHIGNFLTNLQQQGKPVVNVSIKNLVQKVAENYYKIITEALSKILTAPLLLLLGIGLFGHAWSRDKAMLNLYLLSFIIFFWFIVIPLFHINLRYFIPLVPLSFLWIAIGAKNLVECFSKTLEIVTNKVSSSISNKTISVIFLILFVLFGTILPEMGKRMKKYKNSTVEWAPCVEQKKAGLWLKDNGVKNPVIMAYNHAVSFYAGNYNIQQSVEIPENTVDRLLKYAKFRGVKYLVLNDRYKQHHPLIAHLYEQKAVPPQLKLIYLDEMKNGLKTLIYEIVD